MQNYDSQNVFTVDIACSWMWVECKPGIFLTEYRAVLLEIIVDRMVQFQSVMEGISDESSITLLPTLTVTEEFEGGEDFTDLVHQSSLEATAKKKCIVKLDGARYTIGNYILLGWLDSLFLILIDIF